MLRQFLGMDCRPSQHASSTQRWPALQYFAATHQQKNVAALAGFVVTSVLIAVSSKLRLQGTIEGGFMGRTNKLVDGCYSFWQGALFPLLQRLSPQLLAQTSIPVQPMLEPPSASLASAGGLRNGSELISGACGSDVASQIRPADSSGPASAGGGTDAAGAREPARYRVSVPPLPELLARRPAAVAAARAAALKAAADAAVQAALAAQLSAASAGPAAAGGARGAASEWQRRELASERVRQLADVAGGALEVRPHVCPHPVDSVQSKPKPARAACNLP